MSGRVLHAVASVFPESRGCASGRSCSRLPAGGQATPMTYRVGSEGRQFVVIAAGGHGTLGTVPGDAVVAYALPEAD